MPRKQSLKHAYVCIQSSYFLLHNFHHWKLDWFRIVFSDIVHVYGVIKLNTVMEHLTDLCGMCFFSSRRLQFSVEAPEPHLSLAANLPSLSFHVDEEKVNL